ncbi:MAG: alpha/beta fold hydrolase [Verrucomicrobiota bacterium]
MPNNLDLVRTTFLADSLGLGPHWIYNQEKLARLYPEGTLTLDNPHSSYHPKRSKGQFTHFGDQMLVLLRSLTPTQAWSFPIFQSTWLKSMASYDGYIDGATKDSLENLPATPGSTSNDLSGASRIFPLFLLNLELPELIRAARQQTEMTHGDPLVIDTAEFLTRTIQHLSDGKDLAAALEQSAAASYPALPAVDWLQKAKDAASRNTPNETAAEFGLTCHIPEAFPATIQYLYRWLNNGAEKSSHALLQILSENNLAGGDTSARAMPLAAILSAAGCPLPAELYSQLDHASEIDQLLSLLTPQPATPPFEKITFPGANGDHLDARLELPTGPIRATALFAHCFTCGKASRAATAISRQLADQGIATLRFDFTGLGNSDGDFANTSFLSNVDDLLAAADHLRQTHAAPSLLIGHSLGGAAVLAAAGRIPELTHVATIGAPAEPAHVTHLFEDGLDEIQEKGKATVTLAGRPFTIGQKFLTDLQDHNQPEQIAALRKNLLILHSPTDNIVGIENAGQIYSAAKHPKSFLSLPQSDHLLTDPTQADYVANLIATWFTSR